MFKSDGQLHRVKKVLANIKLSCEIRNELLLIFPQILTRFRQLERLVERSRLHIWKKCLIASITSTTVSTFFFRVIQFNEYFSGKINPIWRNKLSDFIIFPDFVQSHPLYPYHLLNALNKMDSCLTISEIYPAFFNGLNSDLPTVPPTAD